MAVNSVGRLLSGSGWLATVHSPLSQSRDLYHDFWRPEINIIVVSDNFIVSEVAHAGWCTLLSVPSSLFIKIAVPAQTKQALLNHILSYGNLKNSEILCFMKKRPQMWPYIRTWYPSGYHSGGKGWNTCRKVEIRWFGPDSMIEKGVIFRAFLWWKNAIIPVLRLSSVFLTAKIHVYQWVLVKRAKRLAEEGVIRGGLIWPFRDSDLYFMKNK